MILILFLGSPRSALIVGITIPFAMIVAFILMRHTNISVNLLSLGAIDFGIIVDGAIVMIGGDPAPARSETGPATHRNRRPRRRAPGGASDLLCHRGHHHHLSAAVRASADRGQAVLSAGLCGRLRAVRRAGVRTAGRAWPRLSRLSPAASHVSQLGAAPARAALLVTLQSSLGRPRIVYALSAAAAIAIILLGATVWREFLPELDEGALFLHAELPPGISLRKATEMVADLQAHRERIPRGVVCRQPHRPQRRRHRSVDALAHGGGDRVARL